MAVRRAAIQLVLMVLLYFSPGVQCFFERISCTISSDCNCDFKPNIRGLEWDLYKNLYGQHLAQDTVSEEVANFLQKESPDRPLVLSFHGGSGTGKTLVSSMLGRHLYGTAMGSPYIHQFVPTLHFPSPDRVQQYRLELKDWVQGNLTACARSIFIFDEMENMPPGVIDILKPFLGPSHTVFGTNYRKAIYIFISTIGEEVIHRMALETRQAGKEREEIRLVDLEDAISQAVFNNSRSGFFHSSIIQEKLLTSFVPFLPLGRRHVERCARRELCQRVDNVLLTETKHVQKCEKADQKASVDKDRFMVETCLLFHK
uniref:Torsin family 2 member A n=1 Tax=Oncorhynchus tshawytscha TaxID=74940 RepID=A0AAZ3QAW5_ONCTS